MQKLFKYNIPFIIWFGLIFYILTMPASGLPKILWLEKIHFDKVVHFLLFFILNALLVIARYFQTDRLSKKTFIIIIILVGSIYGITMEYLQPILTIGRVSDLFDALANVSGTIIGTMLILNKNIKRYVIKENSQG